MSAETITAPAMTAAQARAEEKRLDVAVSRAREALRAQREAVAPDEEVAAGEDALAVTLDARAAHWAAVANALSHGGMGNLDHDLRDVAWSAAWDAGKYSEELAGRARGHARWLRLQAEKSGRPA